MKIDLKTIPIIKLKDLLTEVGEKPYHAVQVARWIYRRYATDFSQMNDLSKSCRLKLEKNYFISELSVAAVIKAKDDSCKYVFSLSDGLEIESVLIPEKDHLTLCISTQVGCRQSCRFCLTARMGFIRNLQAHEIVDQILQIKKRLTHDEQTSNIVLMGMGEPLDNYEHTVQAIRLMTSPLGLNISPRRITLSTAGLVPQIYQLARENLGINLAVSINADDDKIRSYLMPVNRKYNIESLLKALRDFPLAPRRRITIEYILIKGVNDSPDAAQQLTRKLAGLRCKVNLIMYNANPYLPFQPSGEDQLNEFQQILIEHHLTVTVRRSKGGEVLAACGQLGYARSYDQGG